MLALGVALPPAMLDARFCPVAGRPKGSPSVRPAPIFGGGEHGSRLGSPVLLGLRLHSSCRAPSILWCSRNPLLGGRPARPPASEPLEHGPYTRPGCRRLRWRRHLYIKERDRRAPFYHPRRGVLLGCCPIRSPDRPSLRSARSPVCHPLWRGGRHLDRCDPLFLDSVANLPGGMLNGGFLLADIWHVFDKQSFEALLVSLDIVVEFLG